MEDVSNRVGVGLAFVLDDEPGIGIFICKAFIGMGVGTRHFTNPVHFLTEVKSHPPDLVVLDLTLGQSDAVEIIRELDILKFKGRVLLISGRDETTLSQIEQIGRGRGLTMLPSLRKPFRIADIRERVWAPPSSQEQKTESTDGCADESQDQVRVSLEEALKKNWLEVWYQPKLDLKSLTVCGAEALIRARHPEHGVIAPRSLLPSVGDPLYRPLTFFVLRRTMEDWSTFAEKGLLPKLAINVPASILNAPGFVDLLRKTMPSDARFPGLIIEVTEDEVTRDPKLVREVATQLKLYNAWISIDGFGSAYASLSRLKDLEFVELKLDRSFVSNCASDRLKRSLCQTVVELGHRFGASLCAEGVETADDLRCVTAMGFDTAQGYIFAKPMPADRFVECLLSRAGDMGAAARSPLADEAPLRAKA